MKKKEKTVLTDAITDYLQLKELQATQTLQLDALKDLIMRIAEANPTEFTAGELLVEGVGLLKYVANPPKLIYKASGKTMNDTEITGLATELNKIGAGFSKTSLNLKKVCNLVDAQNGAVLSLLNMNGLEVVQDTRLDIKKLSK